MDAGSLSRRYARALLELSKEQGILEVVYQDLLGFSEVLAGSSELSGVLQSPSYTKDQRVGIIRGLLQGKVHETTLKFLLLAAKRDRLRFFDDIFREFNGLRDDEAGIVRVHISSATELPSGVEAQLEQRLKVLAGKNVVLTKDVDPSLIGGVVTKIGNLILDGSLSTQFSRFRAHMDQSDF